MGVEPGPPGWKQRKSNMGPTRVASYIFKFLKKIQSLTSTLIVTWSIIKEKECHISFKGAISKLLPLHKLTMIYHKKGWQILLFSFCFKGCSVFQFSHQAKLVWPCVVSRNTLISKGSWTTRFEVHKVCFHETHMNVSATFERWRKATESENLQSWEGIMFQDR